MEIDTTPKNDALCQFKRPPGIRAHIQVVLVAITNLTRLAESSVNFPSTVSGTGKIL